MLAIGSAANKKINILQKLVFAGAALVALGYVVAAVFAGASAVGFVLFYSAFAVLMFLPGLLLADILVKDMPPADKCIIALPLGAVVLMLGFTAFGSVGIVYLSCVPSIICSGLYLIKKARTKRQSFNNIASPKISLPSKTSDFFAKHYLFIAAFAFILLLYIFCGVLSLAKPSQANNMRYSQDLLWSISNAGSARYGFPVVDMRAQGGMLHYHYFADINNGLLAMFSGQSAWDAVCYYAWPIWAFAMFGGVFLVAKRMGADEKPSLIVAGGFFVFSFLDVSLPQYIYRNPNNVVQCYAMLCAGLLVFLHMQKNLFEKTKPVAAFLIVMVALAWSKTVLAILLVCAIAAAYIVWAIINKKISRNINILLLVSAGIIAALYIAIFSKAIINMDFGFSFTKFKSMLFFLAFTVSPAFLIYLVSLPGSLKNFKMLTMFELMINAMVIGGMLGYLLFSHYSNSENYFLFTACFLMWVCGAKILSKLFTKKVGTAVVSLLCVVAMAGTAWHIAPLGRYGVQTAFRIAGIRPEFETRAGAISKDDEAAALWLKENMATSGEVFATNRNAQDMQTGEGVFHYYTAVSQRQAFVESWRYAMDYSMDYYVLRHNLEQVSDVIFASKDFAVAQQLAKENGINYLLLHLPTAGGEVFAGGQPVFVSDTVLIYKI